MFDTKLCSQVTRYVVTSLAGYVFSVVGINLVAQRFDQNNIAAYAAVYGILYTADYGITCRWVFAVPSSSSRLQRYIIFLFLSWILGTITFALISDLISQIWLAVAVNLGCLFPIRFAISKLWLYAPPQMSSTTNRRM